MMKFTDKKGFSLVELMIVVAIIAILAAIAIPSFLRFAMRSKTAEATSNLAGIRTGEEAYRAEHDVYLDAGLWPLAQPPAAGVLWEAVPNTEGSGFSTIGFAADGVVRYQYLVEVLPAVVVGSPPAGGTPYYTATATGDLDDDGDIATYIVSNNRGDAPEDRVNAAGQTAPSVYPKAILDADGDDF